MNSPFSRGTLYLKRKNEELIAQLESNSVILQERLKQLRTTTAASGPRNSSAQQHSPLKRKNGYQSWLERNSSGQVSAALQPGIFHDSPPSPVSELDFVQPHSYDETIAMSPLKRLRCFSPEDKHNPVPKTAITSKNSKSKIRNRSKPKCPDCYCGKPKQLQTNKTHANKRYGRICVGCSYYKIPQNSPTTKTPTITTPTILNNYEPNLDLRQSLLDEARSVISYSPQSEFLKGLKQRSRVNLNESPTSNPENDPSEVVTAVDFHRKHSKKPTKPTKPNLVANGTDKSKHSRPTIRSKDASFDGSRATNAINKTKIVDRSKTSRPTNKDPSIGTSTNAANKSSHSRPTGKGPNFVVINQTDKSKQIRPATTGPSSGVRKSRHIPNEADRSDYSSRSDTPETARQNRRQRDQSVTSPSQALHNSSVPFRSSKDPRKPVSNTYKASDHRLSRSSKEAYRPATSNTTIPSTSTAALNRSPSKTINRPDVSRFRPSHGRNPTTSPPIVNVRPAGTSFTRKNPLSAPKDNSRLSKISTHSSVSPVKDQYTTSGKADTRGKSLNTANVKLRPSSQYVAGDRATFKVASPTTSSPNSSPRARSEDRTKSRDRLTHPRQPKDNVRPSAKSSGSVRLRGRESRSRHTSEVPERSQPSDTDEKENLKNSPFADKCYKKSKNIHKTSCKTHSRKESKFEKKPFEECYNEIGSPAELRSRCKRTHRKSMRKQPMSGRSCCRYCCCGCQQPTGHECPRQCTKTRSCVCCDPSTDDWVDELSRYRQSHWFDCHSNPGDREWTASSARVNDEFVHTHHNGVHRYMLNDRLFATPLLPSPGYTSCRRPSCQRRDAGARLPPRFRREITLSTMRDRDDVQVILPQVSRLRTKSEERKTEPFKIYHEPEKKTKTNRKSTGCTLTHPIRSKSLAPRFLAPANSLALRYQKGIV